MLFKAQPVHAGIELYMYAAGLVLQICNEGLEYFYVIYFGLEVVLQQRFEAVFRRVHYHDGQRDVVLS